MFKYTKNKNRNNDDWTLIKAIWNMFGHDDGLSNEKARKYLSDIDKWIPNLWNGTYFGSNIDIDQEKNESGSVKITKLSDQWILKILSSKTINHLDRLFDTHVTRCWYDIGNDGWYLEKSVVDSWEILNFKKGICGWKKVEHPIVCDYLSHKYVSQTNNMLSTWTIGIEFQRILTHTQTSWENDKYSDNYSYSVMKKYLMDRYPFLRQKHKEGRSLTLSQGTITNMDMARDLYFFMYYQQKLNFETKWNQIRVSYNFEVTYRLGFDLLASPYSEIKIFRLYKKENGQEMDDNEMYYFVRILKSNKNPQLKEFDITGAKKISDEAVINLINVLYTNCKTLQTMGIVYDWVEKLQQSDIHGDRSHTKSMCKETQNNLFRILASQLSSLKRVVTQ